MSDYKPKVRTDPYAPVWCVLCQKEIPVGDTYHWIKSRSAGTRPICLECAAKYMKIYEDDSKED
jgi:hypothetical protein